MHKYLSSCPKRQQAIPHLLEADSPLWTDYSRNKTCHCNHRNNRKHRNNKPENNSCDQSYPIPIKKLRSLLSGLPKMKNSVYKTWPNMESMAAWVIICETGYLISPKEKWYRWMTKLKSNSKAWITNWIKLGWTWTSFPNGWIHFLATMLAIMTGSF